MSQYARLSTLDPEFAEALALSPPPPGRVDDVVTMRQGFDAMIDMLNQRDKELFPSASELHIEDHKVPVDGGEITVRCMVPTPATGPFPVFVNYHGGGFAIGGLNTDALWIQQICVEQQVSVVNVNYRHAPEFPWPMPHEDSYTALKWVAENVALLRADLSKGFIVGGLSSGGCISASLALRARDDPFFRGRSLTGQLLQVPATIHPLNIPDEFQPELRSMDMSLDIPGVIDQQAILQFYGWWKPDECDINTWPLLHPKHAGVAPAVIQVCGADLLRDEALLYEKLLREAGVQTKLHIYPGVPHGFHLGFSHIKLGKQYHQDRKDGVRWLLGGTK